MSIIEEIKAERLHQHSLWSKTNDDKNTLNDWVTHITFYAGNAAMRCDSPRDELLKVAALAMAAIEACDRNKGFPARHYEQKQKVITPDPRYDDVYEEGVDWLNNLS